MRISQLSIDDGLAKPRTININYKNACSLSLNHSLYCVSIYVHVRILQFSPVSYKSGQ